MGSLPVQLRPIPLWEEGGWDREYLQSVKASGIPAAAWNRGWRLIAASDEDLSFPSFRRCHVPGVVLGPIQRSDWPAFTGVDLSSKKRPGNAIVTVKVDPRTRRRYPVDLRAGKWKSSETAAQISDVYDLYRPTVIMVEDNGYQESLIDWCDQLKLDFWHLIEPTTTTGHTKYNEEVGLPSLEVEFKHGAWVVPLDEFETHPPGHMKEGCMWCRWVHELRNHPLAVTSDFVMATWFARQGIERNKYVFEVPEPLGNLARR